MFQYFLLQRAISIPIPCQNLPNNFFFKRSMVLWTSIRHFPSAAVPRVAARFYFWEEEELNYFATSFCHICWPFFTPRCSWCATARWQRMWSRGSRSTRSKESISRTKTIFSNSRDWQESNRCHISEFCFSPLVFANFTWLLPIRYLWWKRLWCSSPRHSLT